jgi:ankyrin repeat protein
LCAKYGLSAAARLLIRHHDVDLHIKDWRGLSPLELATLNGALEVVTSLIRAGVNLLETTDEYDNLLLLNL